MSMRSYFKLPLFLVLFGLFLQPIFAQTVETKLSAGIAFDGEPNMVANPNNPRHMVVAWMSLGLGGSGTIITIKTRSSFDGGKTWSSAVSLPHFSNDWGSADPTMAFHSSGKLYLAYIDYRQAEDSGGVFLHSSANGGLNWTFESKILDVSESPKLPLDRPWIAIDNSGGTYDGTIYITTKPAPWVPAPNRPYFKVSADAKSWSALRFVDTTGYLVGNLIQAPMASPGVTADGTFVAAYPSYVVSQSVYPKLMLASSNNRAASFSYTDIAVNPGSSGDTLLKGAYLLLPDPVTANQMVFVRLESKAGDADIVLKRTTDKGKTWSNDVRVNDDAVNNGKLQDLVWASWGKNGTLALCWRDRRNGSGSGFTQVSDCYCAVSSDSGKSFGKNIRMTAQSADYHNILTQNGNDFMSCHLNGDTLCAVWGDVRNNKLELWLSSVAWKTNTNGTPRLIVSEDLEPIILFPVPAKNELKVRHQLQAEFPWFVVDVTGKTVLKIEAMEADVIDIGSLPNGTYLLNGHASGSPFSRKFEVRR